MSSIIDYQEVDENGWPVVDDDGYPVLIKFSDMKSMADVERVVALEKPNDVVVKFIKLHLKTRGYRWARKYVAYLKAHDVWKNEYAKYLAALDTWQSQQSGPEPQEPAEPNAPVLEELTVQDVVNAAKPPDTLTRVVKAVKKNRSDIEQIKGQLA